MHTFERGRRVAICMASGGGGGGLQFVRGDGSRLEGSTVHESRKFTSGFLTETAHPCANRCHIAS